ncbi:MAG: Carbonic anhydrase (EC [uncultured Sulfurovum sp.]|uniref:Carbonic anhydrase n=1 Tax=uncultured Sulfurovum sp. TaxID=269237 RepID=A0A6S6U5I8_9BACT|nr:MAG: Carbonic anhydrase (EC [uncultured Sulfurovum sp.]
MKKIISYTSIALSSMLLLSTSSFAETQVKEPTAHAIKHWGYTADVGPSHWGKLNTKFRMCSEGNTQSPINILPTSDIDLPALDLNYTTGSKSVINNGHTVQVNIEDGSVFNIEGMAYKLKQFHFHTPSENNINGASFPLEAHFVHATDDGKLAVVAVMFKEGDANPILTKVWKKLPTLEVGKAVSCGLSAKEVKALMPTDKDYYKFMGSLTTPPCSEEVKWHVFKTPLTISKAQIETFFKLYGHGNNRPVQATHKRIIEE